LITKNNVTSFLRSRTLIPISSQVLRLDVCGVGETAANNADNENIVKWDNDPNQISVDTTDDSSKFLSLHVLNLYPDEPKNTQMISYRFTIGNVPRWDLLMGCLLGVGREVGSMDSKKFATDFNETFPRTAELISQVSRDYFRTPRRGQPPHVV